MAKIVVSHPGERVVSEITALVQRPATPSVAQAPHIGLVQIGEIQPTELIPGPPGAQGPRGSRWYTGDGAPGAIPGVVTGDMYLDNLTDEVWAYDGTAWADTGTNIGGSPDTGPQILAKLAPVDGGGSGLDADLLDGQHGAYYLDWLNQTGKPATFPPTLPIAWTDVSGKPATFPPSAHGHAFTEITGTITAAQHGNLSGSALHAIATSANAGFMVDAVNDGTQYVRKNGSWSPVTVPPGTVISDNPPGSPSHGQEWWQSSTGNMFIFYVDPGGGAGQWVQTNAASANIPDDAGEICWFARSAAPNGFLKANGALVSRTTYSRLFTAIGTTFGVGNGSTTFGLPDLRGEFVRGLDDGRGVDAARALGSAQLDALQQMYGQLIFRTLTGSVSVLFNGTGIFSAPFGAATAGSVGAGSGANTSASGAAFDASTVARTDTETRPRNVALLACVRY